MKWFKKTKPENALMLKSYVPMDSVIYLKSTKPERLKECSPDSVFPFFIKLTAAPFENWVVEFTEVNEKKGSVSFGTIVDLVPKTVDDKEFKKLQPKLKRLLTNIINDIMTHALNKAEAIVISEEK